MALFQRNIVRGVALVIALKGVFISCMALTEPSNVCNSDDTLACRYYCPPESIQEHCASETEKDGYCCPGHYRTNLATCQECPGAHVMPDVNNCSCSCLLCAECPRNDTIKTRCSITTDTACYGTKDPTPRAHSACPWIKTSSAPTTQVLTTQVLTTQVLTTQVSTTEAASVNTPSDPQRSKSERIYEGGFYTFMVLFILLFGFVVLICCYLCYAHHSAVPSPATTPPTNITVPPQGGTDQPDTGDKTWKEVASIVAEQPDGGVQTWKGVARIVAGENEQPDGEVQTWKGVVRIVAEQPDGGVQTWKGVARIVTEQPDGGVQTCKGVARIVAEQICRSCAACRAACPPRGQLPNPPPNPPGGGGGQGEEDHSNENGDDEPDERGLFLPQGDVHQQEETQETGV